MRQARTRGAAIGAHLLAARQEAGLTQDYAAGEIGTSASQISNWERNIYTPSVHFLLVLAEAYLVSPLQLLGHVPGPSPTDPDELGTWLRNLPSRTILSDRHLTAWQLGMGYITVFDGGEPETHDFPALLCVGSEATFSIAKADDFDLDTLAESAPFTVLALGEDQADAEAGDAA